MLRDCLRGLCGHGRCLLIYGVLVALAVFGRQGLIVAVSKTPGDPTPFKVEADGTGRTGWYGRHHLAHA
jgi:hypothetical protein